MSKLGYKSVEVIDTQLGLSLQAKALLSNLLAFYSLSKKMLRSPLKFSVLDTIPFTLAQHIGVISYTEILMLSPENVYAVILDRTDLSSGVLRFYALQSENNWLQYTDIAISNVVPNGTTSGINTGTFFIFFKNTFIVIYQDKTTSYFKVSYQSGRSVLSDDPADWTTVTFSPDTTGLSGMLNPISHAIIDDILYISLNDDSIWSSTDGITYTRFYANESLFIFALNKKLFAVRDINSKRKEIGYYLPTGDFVFLKRYSADIIKLGSVGEKLIVLAWQHYELRVYLIDTDSFESEEIGQIDTVYGYEFNVLYSGNDYFYFSVESNLTHITSLYCITREGGFFRTAIFDEYLDDNAFRLVSGLPVSNLEEPDYMRFVGFSKSKWLNGTVNVHLLSLFPDDTEELADLLIIDTNYIHLGEHAPVGIVVEYFPYDYTDLITENDIQFKVFFDTKEEYTEILDLYTCLFEEAQNVLPRSIKDPSELTLTNFINSRRTAFLPFKKNSPYTRATAVKIEALFNPGGGGTLIEGVKSIRYIYKPLAIYE